MLGRPKKYMENVSDYHFKIPDSLGADLKALAHETGLSINEVAIDALSRYIGCEEGLKAYSKELQSLKAKLAELETNKRIGEPMATEQKLYKCVICGTESPSDICSPICRAVYLKKIKNKTCRKCGQPSGDKSFCSEDCYERYRLEKYPYLYRKSKPEE